MKYLILLMMLMPFNALACEFHYRDKVRIVKGFYTGCTGVVSSIEEADPMFSIIKYTVYLEACDNNKETIIVVVSCKDMEKR